MTEHITNQEEFYEQTLDSLLSCQDNPSEFVSKELDLFIQAAEHYKCCSLTLPGANLKEKVAQARTTNKLLSDSLKRALTTKIEELYNGKEG